MLQANQRVEEYKQQIKSLTVRLKEVSVFTSHYHKFNKLSQRYEIFLHKHCNLRIG